MMEREWEETDNDGGSGRRQTIMEGVGGDRP